MRHRRQDVWAQFSNKKNTKPHTGPSRQQRELQLLRRHHGHKSQNLPSPLFQKAWLGFSEYTVLATLENCKVCFLSTISCLCSINPTALRPKAPKHAVMQLWWHQNRNWKCHFYTIGCKSCLSATSVSSLGWSLLSSGSLSPQMELGNPWRIARPPSESHMPPPPTLACYAWQNEAGTTNASRATSKQSHPSLPFPSLTRSGGAAAKAKVVKGKRICSNISHIGVTYIERPSGLRSWCQTGNGEELSSILTEPDPAIHSAVAYFFLFHMQHSKHCPSMVQRDGCCKSQGSLDIIYKSSITAKIYALRRGHTDMDACLGMYLHIMHMCYLHSRYLPTTVPCSNM